MKKTIFTVFLVGCLIGIFTIQAYSMDTAELIKKMIEAQGGQKNMEKALTTVTKGTLVIVAQGLEGTFEMKSKRPMKSLNKFEIMGTTIIQAFDGKMAWTDNPMAGGVMELSGPDAENQKRNSFGPDTLWDPKKYGLTYTFKGKEKADGKDYYILEQTFKDGKKNKMFIDTKSFLTYKSVGRVESSQGSANNETFFSDYKKVSGIVTAHKLKIVRDGAEYLNLIIDSITINTKIDDSEFVMKK